MDKKKDTKGRIVVVSGPSGVGKSTICKEVVRRKSDVWLSVSVTTREKSELEMDGEDYRFISRQEFEKRIAAGVLLEYAEVFGNLYGTPQDKVDEMLAEGKKVILEIDVQGARQAKAKYPDAIMIFILPPTQKELAERLNDRGREDIESTEERLGGAGTEIAAAWQYYNHMVINDELEQAVSEVIQVIEGNETYEPL